MNILAWILLAIGLVVITGNYSIIIGWFISKRRGSQIPIIGGGLAAIGLFFVNNGQHHNFFWIPILADPGCAFLLIAFLIDKIRK